MRVSILLLIVNLLIGCASPRVTVADGSEINTLYQQGVAAVRSGELDQAKKIFESCLQRDSSYAEAHLGLAEVAYQQSDLVTAMQHLDKRLASDTEEGLAQAYYLQGLVAWQQQDYLASKNAFAHYLEDPSATRYQKEAAKYLRDSRYHMESASAPETKLDCKLSGINTSAPEYLPTAPAHEEMMIFTRRLSGQEDLYVSEKIDEETWSEATPLVDINTRENEGAHTISVDGNTLVFTRCGVQGGLGSCDLYFSTFRDGRWSEAQNLGPEINSTSWDAQPCFSPNMRRLYFASERPGGKGGRDIWYADRTAQGWTTPKNLSNLNTADNDESPFLHSDGQHIYFMSQGHPGYGGYDLFTSAGKFEEVTNLGPTINTTADEGSLHVMRDGMTGYYARSQVEDRRLIDSDICQVTLPPMVRALATTFVEIQVFDQTTGEQIDANVRIADSTSNAIGVYSAFASQRSIYTLPGGSSYSLQIDRPGYTFHSQRFRIDSSSSMLEPFFLRISIQPVDKLAEDTAPVLLENVFFATGSALLLPSSHRELDFLVRKMQAEPKISFEIAGHTDDVGDEETNLLLSQERAKSVYEYLIQRGVSPARLAYVGYGESRPIASNDTDQGRALNRRTEIKIFKN